MFTDTSIRYIRKKRVQNVGTDIISASLTITAKQGDKGMDNHNAEGSSTPILLEDYLALGLYDWFPTAKKEYQIQAKMVSDQTAVYNFLEDTHYIAHKDSDVVLKGSLGEEWINKLSIVSITYTKLDGSKITLGDFSERDKYIDIKTVPGKRYFAYFIPVKYKVEVYITEFSLLHANRDGIVHGDGDYLVCSVDEHGKPDLSTVWVVNGTQFVMNYDLTQQNT